MTLKELKELKVGSIVRMGRYHWVMEGHNSLKEPVFHRVDDSSVKMLDSVFIAHLLTIADDGYEYNPKVEKIAPESAVEEEDEIVIQQPKKRGRPKKKQ